MKNFIKTSGNARAKIRPAARRFSALILLGFLAALPLPAQRMQIDIRSQYLLYLKALTFDRALLPRAGEDLVIGILFEGTSRPSRSAKDAMVEAVSRGPADFEGLPIRCVPIPVGRGTNLHDVFEREGVDVIYVAPMEIFGLGSVVEICREHQIATFTGIPDYLRDGISISFRMGSRKGEIIIDLENSKREGSDFSSQFLNMVTVIERPAASRP